jgi:DNA-binding phage protein
MVERRKIMLSAKISYMASIGLDTAEIIKAYYNAYLEFDNIDYFITAHELTRIGFEEDERDVEQYLKSR